MVIVRKKLNIFLFLWLPAVAAAQQSAPDILKHQLASTQNDSVRYEIYSKLSDFYIE